MSSPSPTGSSPHTRGLHSEVFVALGAEGIIPAHAGFTPRRTPTCTGWTDHPRTRGVYPVRTSSLATRSGIIPAHAGFTSPQCLRLPTRTDHPRTRGVYVPHGVTRQNRPGSSPHTRGLLTGHVENEEVLGIIPAHAGFTARGWPGPGPRRDHPRTRGVYSRCWEENHLTQGSSPHTRGLPR